MIAIQKLFPFCKASLYSAEQFLVFMNATKYLSLL